MLVCGMHKWVSRTLKSKNGIPWEQTPDITFDIEKGRVEEFDCSSFSGKYDFCTMIVFYVSRFYRLEAN
jgi:hypothetical protein